MKNQNKQRKNRLFDLTRDGAGISKKEPLSESGLKRFFITYKTNFGKLVSVNMFMVLGNFPLIFLIMAFSGYTKAEAIIPSSDLFQNLSGIFSATAPSPFNMSLYALEGLQESVLLPTTLTYIFYGLGALTLFTFGLVNVGTAYILRNMAMGEPVFVWTDFWYAVKRNWRQALPFGVIDGLINVLLIFNIYTMITAGSSFFASMLFWGSIILVVLYFFMRPYIYIQMLTFDLGVFKILKNSLIFALAGLKRNVISLLATVILVLLELCFIFALGALLIPLAIAMPLAIMFSTLAYAKVFAAYFKIKELMIDPYKAEHPELFANEDDEEDEAIMKDDVTERERLAEIKKKNGIR